MAKGKKQGDVGEVQPVEVWAKELGTPAWLFAAAREREKWPEGKLLTRAEYERAIQAAGSEVIG